MRSRSRAAAPSASFAEISSATASASASSRMRRVGLARKGGGRNSVTLSSIVASAAVMRGVSPSTKATSAPGVARGRDAVKEVVADMEIFPPHGIVQRVGARVAPVAVEIVLAKRRARAAELMQFVGRQNRDLGRENLGLGHLHRRLCDRFLARIVQNPVNRLPGAFKQSLGGVELHFEIANLRDGEDVLVAMLLAAVDPGPHTAAHETDHLIESAPRDARVNRRLDDLRDRSVRGGALATKIGGNQGFRRDANVLDQNIAACRRALAEARPVVDDRKSGCRAWRDRKMDIAAFVDRADVDEMGEQRTRRIELLAIHHERVAITLHRSFKGAHVLALGLREGVAEAIAL